MHLRRAPLWRLIILLGSAAILGGAGALVGGITPATAAGPILVTTTADSVDDAPGDGACADAGGQCSLRAAVQEANAKVGADTILLPAGVYGLAVAGAGEDVAATGDLDITGTLTLVGTGEPTIDANGIDRALDLRPGGILYLVGVRLSDGNPGSNPGGALRTGTSSFAAVTNGRIDASRSLAGGGIWAEGALTVTNSTIETNQATLFGGGVAATSGFTATGSTIRQNTATTGAGVVTFAAGTTTFTDSTLQANSATSDGGGLVTTRPTSITGTTISHNTARHGGGISALPGGSLAVTSSTLSTNTANGWGGAIVAEANITVTATHLHANHADLGGAVATTRALTVTTTTIDANTADLAGAGVVSLAGTSALTVTNSTLSGNTTAGPGGAIAHASATTIEATTITDNLSTTGGGVLTLGPGEGGTSGGTTHLRNTIVGDQQGGGDCAGGGPVTSAGWNLSTSSAGLCGLDQPTDVPNQASAALLPLGDHGGPTPTHLLADGSPGIDAGNTTLPTDQRGTPRGLGGHDDIGATEVAAPIALVVDSAADTSDAVPGDGSCADASGDCTLRAAIDESNAWDDELEAGDDITITAGLSPISLQILGTDDTNAGGDLDVAGTVRIHGAGTTIDGAGIDRVIDLHTGALSLADVTVTGGQAPWSTHGGGVRTAVGTDLTVTDGAITANQAASGGGGGLLLLGSATLTRVEISGNVAGSTGGAGLHMGRTDVVVSDSTITGNTTATGPGSGLAVTPIGASDDVGTLTLTDVVVSGNTGSSGAVFVTSTLTTEVTLRRVAVVTNTSTASASAITAAGAALLLENTTVAGNTAPAGSVGGVTTNAESTIVHATIAYNTGTQLAGGGVDLSASVLTGPTAPVCSGIPPATLGYNVASDISCGLVDPTDQVTNPLLGGLQDHGGDTITALPTPTSPLVDAIPGGVDGCDTSIDVDQRKMVRPDGGGCDIGAAEGALAAAPPLDLVVDTAADAVDADTGDGECRTADDTCSLRAAVQQANAHLGEGTVPDRITIGPGVDPALGLAGIDDTAAAGDLDVTGHLVVEGEGATVDGNDIDRVFDILGGIVELRELTITDGTATTGGGIRTASSLRLDGTTLTANNATSGGAIYNSGALIVQHSTLGTNGATNGGGLYNTRHASVVASTLSANTGASGVAVYSSGSFPSTTVTLRHATISDNTGSSSVVAAPSGSLTLEWSTLAGNHGPTIVTGQATTNQFRATILRHLEGPACTMTGSQPSGGHVISDGTCVAAGDPTNLTGNPVLAPLGDNGGPTATHLAAANSPAVDAVPVGFAGCGTTQTVDQRGVTRPAGGACDIGAVEGSGPSALPLVIEVDTAADAVDVVPGDGLCETASSTCSLRAAVQESNAWPTDDTIILDPGVDPTITLADPGDEGGDLDVRDSLTLEGGGATVDGAAVDRVFEVIGGTTSISDLTVTGGRATTGGGFLVSRVLHLHGVGIDANTATSTGGGIQVASSGAVTLDEVTVHANTAPSGAGIYTVGTTTVSRSRLTANTATSNGGGLYNSGTLGLSASTVDANTATSGGGIYNHSGTATLQNATFSGNNAASGTQIYGRGTVDVTASTVVTASTGTAIFRSSGTTRLRAVAVWAPVGTACGGTITSQGYNVTSDATCGSQPTDVAAAAMLGALADNGGPTPTHLPFAGSPVLDAVPVGNPACTPSLTVDQRGETRPNGALCDVGAVEGGGPPLVPLDLAVDSPLDALDADESDGVCETAAGTCTLRAAVQQANVWPTADTITIGSGIDPVLSRAGTGEDLGATGDLDVYGVLTIEGNGAVVDANDLDRVIEIRTGTTTIRELELTDGMASNGGGVYNRATLILEDVSLTANQATTGAGLETSGTATLERVTVTGGSTPTTSSARGAGIRNTGTLTIDASTITGNTTNGGYGGGVYSSGPLTVTDTLIKGNAAVRGGGIGLEGGSPLIERSALIDNTATSRGAHLEVASSTAPTVRNSTFSSQVGGAVSQINSASTSGLWVTSSTLVVPAGATGFHGTGAVVQATAVHAPAGQACSTSRPQSQGWNVVSDATCAFAVTGDVVAATLLGPLGDHGGPTPTHLPYESSPLLDAIPVSATWCGVNLVADQRGEVRPAGSGCDIGAVEGSVPLPAPLSYTVDTSSDGTDADINDGLCLTAAGQCSLRAAIQQTNVWPTADSITIANGIDPTLSITGADEDHSARGDLDIRDRLVITGNGSSIDGNDLDRVLDVHAGPVTIESLRITDGSTAAGGGVRNAGSLRLEEVVMEANRATSTGGAVYNSGDLEIVDSDLLDNGASSGGAVYNTGSLEIETTSVAEGDAVTAGAVYNTGTASLLRSTVTANYSTNNVILNTGSSAVLTVTETTVARNTGGGRAVVGATGSVTSLTNSTVHANATTGRSEIENSGTMSLRYTTVDADEGNALRRAAGTTTVQATILSTYGGAACTGSAVVVSLGANLTADSTCGLTDPSDLVGEADLGPVTDNGGPTETALPFATSPAIDSIPAGAADCGTATTNDQRGVARPAGGSCDRGAVEGAGPVPSTLHLVVDTASDGQDADPMDGTCATATATCTLRAAVQQANAWPTDDTITITPGLDPVVTLPGAGENHSSQGDLDIRDTVAIEGNGATVDGQYVDSVFEVIRGTVHLDDLTVRRAAPNALFVRSQATVALADVHLTQSASSGPALDNLGTLTWNGGSATANAQALANRGTATVEDVEISGNGPASGSALTASSGSLVLDRTTISDNVGGSSRALLVAAEVTIRDSAISDNSATGSGVVVDIDPGGDLTIEGSTLTDNTAARLVESDGGLSILQSTISANTMSEAVVVTDAPATVRHSTVHGNSSPGPAVGSTLAHSLVLESSIISHAGPACADPAASSSTYSSVSDGSCELSGPTNLQYQNPFLGPLTGSSPAHVPLVGSPVVDAVPFGTLGCGTTLLVDQQGGPRPIGSACDIGAVEGPSGLPPAPLAVVVDTAADSDDADPGDGVCADTGGDCSLRAAIQETNVRSSADTVSFVAGVDPVLGLTSADSDSTGDLDVRDHLTIDGGGVTLSGADSTNIIENHTGLLVIEDAILRDGLSVSTPTEGAAIRNISGVILRRTTFVDNVAGPSRSGGALYNLAGGVATVEDSTFTQNQAGGYGGAVVNIGEMSIINSTFSGNSAATAGGAIGNAGTLSVRYSTITANSAPSNGGSLFHYVGTTWVSASIVANPTSGSNCAGWIDSLGANLASDTTCQFTDVGDQESADALLGPLQDNGGPTLTHAPGPGSPAVDAIAPGSHQCGATVVTDQRGQARPSGAACDRGAVEVP